MIQMETIGPQESQEFHNAILDLDGDYFDVPMLGSIAVAKAGTL